jgi:hypothetical protein
MQGVEIEFHQGSLVKLFSTPRKDAARAKISDE